MRKMLMCYAFCLFAITTALAQTRTLHGRVINDKGDPVAFASVKLKGSKSGVIADDAGNFTIFLKGDDNALIISAADVVTTTVPVGNETQLTVTVKAKSGELAAVVVTALGIKREAKSLGYATAQISSKDMNESQPVNAAAGITGKVSGMEVQLTNSGVNPDNLRITLRGNRSFLGNNEALIVVDGVPVDNTYLAQMNPSDIESVNVLKGATAAALYGSQASNGVMIVTTKAGRKGKPTINFTSTATYDKVDFLPKLQYSYGSASTEYEDADAVSYSNPYNFQNGFVPFENQSFGAPFSAGSPYGGDSVIVGTQLEGGGIQKVPYQAAAGQFKKFWKTGQTYQNGLSYSGGDDNSTYFLSMQNVNRSGIVPDDKYTRNTIRFNGSRKYGIFRASANASYSASEVNTGDLADAYNNIMNIAPVIPYTNYSNVNAGYGTINTFYNAYGLNPYMYLYNNRDVQKRNDIQGNVDLSLNATGWLNIDYLIGIENFYISDDSTVGAFNYSPYTIFMGQNTLAGNMSIFHGNTPPGNLNLNSTDQKFYSNLKINLHKTFGDFTTQLILGNVVNQETLGEIGNSSSTLLNIPNFYNVNYRQGTPGVAQFSSESRNYGNYADLSVSYRNYLFLHASGRADGTSLLNAGYRNYFYPGVDAAAVLSDMIGALKESKTISFLKIRAALTRTGNIDVYPYSVQNVFGIGTGFPFGSTAGLTTPYSSTTPSLSPEFTTSKEVGGDIAFLKSRIDLQASYFSEKTTNETVSIGVSPTTGYQSATKNLGEMDNKGLELDLKLEPLRLANGFRWDVGVHYTHYVNKVVSLGASNSLEISSTGGTSNSYAVVGKAYTSLLLNDWQRDPAGQVIVNANTGYPTIGASLVNFGTTNPTQALGLTTAFSFKGFTLSAVAEYRGGNVIYNGIGPTLDVDGLSARSAQFAHTKFVYPNSVYLASNGQYVQNTNIQIQDAAIGWWSLPGSMYMTSGAFWTLRNVSLAYSLPGEVLRRLKFVQNLTVSLVGSNLFIVVPKSNVWTDPEFSLSTGNATGSNSDAQAPPTRTFGASLNVTF